MMIKTVKDLIEELKNFNPDSKVTINVEHQEKFYNLDIINIEDIYNDEIQINVNL